MFVYGTLRPGHERWPALAPFAVSWEPATVAGVVWDTGRGYPAARFAVEGSVVSGVLVRLDPLLVFEAVRVLDAIEDEGRLYRRIVVTTSAGPAFAYEWIGERTG